MKRTISGLLFSCLTVAVLGLGCSNTGANAEAVAPAPVSFEIKSDLLKSASYDQTVQLLMLTLVNGSAFNYYCVPESIVTELQRAESKGAFYTRNIKGKFESSKVGETPIVSAQYNETKQIMTICFNNNSCYDYANVPKNVYLALSNNKSMPAYFYANIKGKYDYTKKN